ncbi:unnamed protein product [Lactuca virosa]|uniref:Uncharacterized protein n=1 Tax=Lactuca virosa TaxID=75947 RepID=A0AAU9LNZ2_9ASTR|nr:unnamed protein product [Lactuca virosa]
MEWVLPEKKTIEEYAFFLSPWNGGAAIKPESWASAAQPPSKYKRYEYDYEGFRYITDDSQKGGFFGANMCLVLVQCSPFCFMWAQLSFVSPFDVCETVD